MENAIEVKGLMKKYEQFELGPLDLELPKGSIMGLVGANGSGKSTTIKSILNLIKIDGGTIKVNENDRGAFDKESIGVILDEFHFPLHLTGKEIKRLQKQMYTQWDEEKFNELMIKFELPLDKAMKEFSKGMKMKMLIATTLSYHPKLLILDEVTSGLDPIIRDEILDIFLEFVQDENNSVLVSSHITSDLEKIADYITFLDKGEKIFLKTKDEILYEFSIVKCTKEVFAQIDPRDYLSSVKTDFNYQLLINNKETFQSKYAELKEIIYDVPTIDEVMLLYVKGSR